MPHFMSIKFKYLAFSLLIILSAGYLGYRQGSRSHRQQTNDQPIATSQSEAATPNPLFVPATGKLDLLWLVYEGNTLRSAWVMTHQAQIAPDNLIFTPVYPFAPAEGGTWQSMQPWQVPLQRKGEAPPDMAALGKFATALHLEGLDGFVVLDMQGVSTGLQALSEQEFSVPPALQKVEDLPERATLIERLCRAFMQASPSQREPLQQYVLAHLYAWPGSILDPYRSLRDLMAQDGLSCTLPLVLP